MTKKSYEVAERISVVNGAPVPDDRIVKLTDKEAMFDLANGRISPIVPKSKGGKSKSDTAPE
ncbi:MAG: hypothetical protein ABJL55_16340 [Roseibium sp.]